ncbi:MAG: group III truncated hemoglobin [Aureispira sp.]
MDKQDIGTRADLEQLLQLFYETLLLEKEMQHIFLEVAQLDLIGHLPLLVDFWEQALLQANGYHRNVLKIHTDLHYKIPLTAAHFQQWLQVFEATVDALFIGPIAQKAKNRAQSIAIVIQSKLARS